MAPPAIHGARCSATLRFWMVGVLLLCVFPLFSCTDKRSPQQRLDDAHQLFVQGDLPACQKEAATSYRNFRDSAPQWAAKFANQEAECLIWAGSYREALQLFSERTFSLEDTDSRIRALGLEVAANTNLGNQESAHQRLQEAEGLCQKTMPPSCANLSIAAGMLSIKEGQLESAEKHFSGGLAFARRNGDRMTEATAQLDLGLSALRQRRFDEAADRNAEAFRLADALGNRDIAQNALGNEAWGYLRLGNFSRAMELFADAEKRATAVGDLSDQADWLIGMGKIEFARSHFAAASCAFRRALKLEDRVGSEEDIYLAESSLANIAVQTGDLPEGDNHTRRALDIARAEKSRADEIYPTLIEGQIAAHRDDRGQAERKFREVEQDASSQVFLKWEAQHLLARLAEDQNQVDLANQEYRAALATFETAWPTVSRAATGISFLSNGVNIYDDYVHFLVANGRTDEALRWAEQSRGRTLAQGLGLIGQNVPTEPPPLNAQQIAARAGGTLLFYWLGQKQSYLWAITPQKTTLFPLPPAAEIEAALERYHDTLDANGNGDLLSPPDRDGLWLYRTLVAPAQSLIPKDSRVFILADAGLNNLNFETLIVPDPNPHFWIEDATVVCASSLLFLDRPEPRTPRPPQRLLLIGNSISPSDAYPALKGAAEQIQVVSRHFAGHNPRIVEGENATPASYLAAHPEQYSIIHFVAHGTASRTSPLDSAIVLSRPADGSDSFKLYARDIVPHTIRPDLVVVSACHSAGESAFAGEGPVGLTWGFLRAGARNVIAALGEASATSSVPMMDDFYRALNQGKGPDAALRFAKLNLLRDPKFRTPHFWAPFQLYGTGRMRPAH